MQEEIGRSQTTLGFASIEARFSSHTGVWLGLSEAQKKSILVLDVEGTDSRERGEDHGVRFHSFGDSLKRQVFERKTSLFSLALSEILIINMWTNDVGRYVLTRLFLIRHAQSLGLKERITVS